MFIATNLRQVFDREIKGISLEYVFKTRLAKTHDKRVLKFGLQIMCATFNFVMWIKPAEVIRQLTIGLQYIFAEHALELLLDLT